MSDLKIAYHSGGSYDIAIEENDFTLVGDDQGSYADEVRQRVIYSVGVWQGESAFDRTVGFPWEQGVFGRTPIEGITSLLYEYVAGVDGVESVDETPTLVLDRATRKLTANVSATISGYSESVQLVVQEVDG